MRDRHLPRLEGGGLDREITAAPSAAGESG